MTMKSGLPTGMIRKRLEFKYDYLGRRVQKKVLNNWTGTSGATVTHLKYVYDGHNLIAELDASVNSKPVLSTYVWGLDLSGTMQGAGGVGGLLMVKDGTKTYFPAYDGNGNLLALLDSADGSLDAKYEYGAFGEPLRVGGTAIAADNPFRFSTKYTDVESGLVYYGFRYYSPSLGRFLNRDPLGEAGGSNLYAFVENDPVNGWDYLGLNDELICTPEEYMEGLCDNEYRLNWRVDRLRREAEASRARALELAVDYELLRMEGCFGSGCEVPQKQKPSQDDGASILEPDSGSEQEADFQGAFKSTPESIKRWQAVNPIEIIDVSTVADPELRAILIALLNSSKFRRWAPIAEDYRNKRFDRKGKEKKGGKFIKEPALVYIFVNGEIEPRVINNRDVFITGKPVRFSARIAEVHVAFEGYLSPRVVNIVIHGHPRGTLPSPKDYDNSAWIFVLSESTKVGDRTPIVYIVNPEKTQGWYIPTELLVPQP